MSDLMEGRGYADTFEGRLMLRILPGSVWMLIVTGVAVLLQLAEPVGILSVVLLLPFLTVLTVNVGLILLALEAIYGRVPRWLVILPILYFSGYVAAAWASHSALHQARMDFARDGGSVPFDKAKYALVFAGTTFPPYAAARETLSHYDIAVVYGSGVAEGLNGYVAYRLATPPICEQAKALPHSAGVVTISNTASVVVTCIVGLPEEPTHPVFEIVSKITESNDWLLPMTVRQIDVTTPSAGTLRFRSGSAQTLTWVPLPFLGCGGIPIPGEGACFAFFWRESHGVPTRSRSEPRDTVAEVANAIGLRAVRSPSIGGMTELSDRIAAIARRQSDDPPR